MKNYEKITTNWKYVDNDVYEKLLTTTKKKLRIKNNGKDNRQFVHPCFAFK